LRTNSARKSKIGGVYDRLNLELELDLELDVRRKRNMVATVGRTNLSIAIRGKRVQVLHTLNHSTNKLMLRFPSTSINNDSGLNANSMLFSWTWKDVRKNEMAVKNAPYAERSEAHF